jgi:hypothetical protein
MDRDVLDVIEREIDAEARTRFPGAAVRQVAVLQHGDDPQIEPRDLSVRVILDSDGPDDDERTWKGFAGRHQAAIEEFPRYLAVEFTFNVPVTRDGHCPRMSRGVAHTDTPIARLIVLVSLDGVAGAQRLLVDLAGRKHGQPVRHEHVPRCLEPGQLRPDVLLQRQRHHDGAGGGDHDRAHGLAPGVVGHPDDGDRADRGVREQALLDL